MCKGPYSSIYLTNRGLHYSEVKNTELRSAVKLCSRGIDNDKLFKLSH